MQHTGLHILQEFPNQHFNMKNKKVSMNQWINEEVYDKICFKYTE